MPLMEKGMSMEEARDKCYPDNPVSNTSTKFNFKNFYHVTRPATDRTLSQAIVLIKALIREYGMPTHIRISTSYEMGKPFVHRFLSIVFAHYISAKSILWKDTQNHKS